MDKEVWVDVPDYEGYYQVSDLGRVKSLDRLDSVGRKMKSQIIKPYFNNKGYKIVSLCKNAVVSKIQVHQLVAMAFLGHTPCGYDVVVDHLEGKLCNCVFNLELVTQRENTTRGYKKRKTSSKYVGVYLNKSTGKWMSSIMVDGEKKYLGVFGNEENAAKYYQMALDSIKRGEKIKISRVRKITSKYAGVSYHKSSGKWRARVYVHGRENLLGYFNTEHEAHIAYEKELKTMK